MIRSYNWVETLHTRTEYRYAFMQLYWNTVDCKKTKQKHSMGQLWETKFRLPAAGIP